MHGSEKKRKQKPEEKGRKKSREIRPTTASSSRVKSSPPRRRQASTYGCLPGTGPPASTARLTPPPPSSPARQIIPSFFFLPVKPPHRKSSLVLHNLQPPQAGTRRPASLGSRHPPTRPLARFAARHRSLLSPLARSGRGGCGPFPPGGRSMRAGFHRGPESEGGGGPAAPAPRASRRAGPRWHPRQKAKILALPRPLHHLPL